MHDNQYQTAGDRIGINAQAERVCTRASGCRRGTRLFCVAQKFASVLIIFSFLVKVEASFCDPNDPSTCGFGGNCVPARSIAQISLDDIGAERYICECPSMPCYIALPIDAVCGLERGVQKTYFNELCRRSRECLIQASITPICKGICNEDCRPLTEEACNEEEQLFCNANGGLCVIDRGTQNPQPFCKCYKGFTGDRCLFKSSPVLSGTDSKSEESVNFQLGFFFCIGLLGVMLVLQTAYCVISMRRGYSPDNDKCCKGGEVVAPEVQTKLPEPISG